MQYPKPILMYIDSFIISGSAARTKNTDEFNPELAKIPGLWNTFFSENQVDKILNKVPDSTLFGTYSDYESDANGAYTVTLGFHVEEFNIHFSNLEIAQGYYLIFQNKGESPKAVIEAWRWVWHYFSTQKTYQRRFVTDFEAYAGKEDVAIYIGIKDID